MLTRIATLSAILMATGLAACSTTYSPPGTAGGPTPVSGPGPLDRVGFEGNIYTPADTVQKFALYRCAELARSRGKSHFLLYDSLVNAAMEHPSPLPRVGTVGSKPSASAFMLALDTPRTGSRATQAVLDELAPFVHASHPTAR
jgi:hypothetical protein